MMLCVSILGLLVTNVVATELFESTGFHCKIRNSMRLDRSLHGNPQETAPPFELTVLDGRGVRVDYYETGQEYKVRLVGYVHFRGILLQPRLCSSEGFMIGSLRGGKFVEDDNWKNYGVGFQDCSQGETNNSITHVNDDKKFLMEVVWKAQRDVGAVQFLVSIASENGMYWERWRPRNGLIRPTYQQSSPIEEQLFMNKTESEGLVVNEADIFGLPFDASVFEESDTSSGLEAMGTGNVIDMSDITQDLSNADDKAVSHLATRMFKKFEPEPGLTTDDLRFLNSHAQLTHKDSVVEMTPEETCRQTKPCQNDGYCHVVDDKVHCECRRGWVGETCEVKDACLEHGCSEGAKCVNDLKGGYTCKCRPGFVGTYCQFECEKDHCKNEGECIMTKSGLIACKCVEGTFGSLCEREINECNYNHCKNGAACTDLFNDYKCNCTKGWMGKNCDRPCQDVYGSCRVWKREGQCESMRPSTDFFDNNCAASCGMCEFDNATVITSTPLPPILFPLAWLLGEWTCHVRGFRNKSIDFPVAMENSTGYNETVTFSVSKALMFGTPSINYTARAVADNDPSNIHESTGFLSIRQYPPAGDDGLRASLMTVNNLGITLIEEGDIMMTKNTGGNHLNLIPTYIVPFEEDSSKIPSKINRSFVRKGSRLMQLITRDYKGRTSKYTKTYTRTRKFKY